MGWLKKLYIYTRCKKYYTKQNQQIEYAYKNGYINKIQYKFLKDNNEKFLLKFRHAVASNYKGNGIYDLYYKTSKYKHDKILNAKVDEKVYVGNAPDRIQVKTENEFYDKFDVLKSCNIEMQKKLFKDEEMQEIFLKRAQQEASNLKITDSTFLLYLEDKLYEFIYINKMEDNFSEQDLQELDMQVDEIIKKINTDIMYLKPGPGDEL